MRTVTAGLVIVCVAVVFFVCGARAGETIEIEGRTYTVVPDEEFRELGFEFPDVALDENAATYYLKAFEAYSRIESRSKESKLRDAVLKDRWTDESRPLADYLERNKETLRLIKQAAAKEKCHFPVLVPLGESLETVQTYGILLPQLARLRDFGRFVITKGKALEYENRVGEALDAYVLVLRIGNHTAQDPTLIAGLVGLACNQMGMRAIEQCLLRSDVDGGTLDRVQKQVHALSGERPNVVTAMRSERAFSTNIVEFLIRHPDQLEDLGVDSVLIRAAFMAMFETEAGREQARRDVSEFWDAMDEAIEMPLPEYITSGAGDDPVEKARARKMPPNIMGLLGPGLSRARIQYARNQLCWTVLDVEFALARYALQEGYYPKSLDALKPFMLSDGIDPYSGKSLHYRLEAEGGFTIWSVGINQTDEGGVLGPKHGWRWNEDDYVWNSAAIHGEN